MSVLVRIPTPLQKLVGDRAEVSVEATDLRGAVNELASQSDEFKTRMLDDKGELRRFVNVYVNEEDVRFLQKLDTPLKDGDEVSIVPAIAGGSAVATENAVSVVLPGALRSDFGGSTELTINAETVGELIERLGEINPKFPGLIIKDGVWNPRSRIVISVGGEDVRHLQKLETPLRNGDEVLLVPQIAGGLWIAPTKKNLVRVVLPGVLRDNFDGARELSIEVNTVHELVSQLSEKYPALPVHIDRRAVIIFVNEQDIRHLQKLDTKLHSDDEVLIVPAVIGGQI